MNIDSYQKISFKGYSMYPFLLPGDIILVKGYSLEDIMPGDIIVYYDSIKKKNVAHRAIQVNPLKIKGDNLISYDDIELLETDLIGKVNSIERHDRIYTINSIFSRSIAFLSACNCTPGIIKAHVFGKPIKWFLRTIGVVHEERNLRIKR